MTAAGVCREVNPGGVMRCPAPGRTPGRTCEAYLGTAGPKAHVRICLSDQAPPERTTAYHLRRCPDRKCGAWLRIETREG
jgi:hypothetical protein